MVELYTVTDTIICKKLKLIYMYLYSVSLSNEKCHVFVTKTRENLYVVTKVLIHSD